MRRRKIPIITKKIVSSVIITGFLLCTVISIAGYWSFTTQFKNQYDTSVLSICTTVRENLNAEKLTYYGRQKTPDAEYEATREVLQGFVDKFDLNLLYVSIVEPPEYSHITYVFNPVKKGGKWKEFPIGYEEDYKNEQYSASIKRVYENGETLVRHTFNTRSGSHITANVPVYDKSGTVIAVVGTQKPVQEFVNARHSYLKLILIAEIIFAVAFIFVFGSYFNTNFISPVMMITRETDHFASWGGEPSDNLLHIKNRDELGILAHSVHQMENDVCRNIKELTKVTAEKERISTELNLAAKIQLDALPSGYPPFPDRKDFDLFATMTPAKEVGGDLYDYMLLDDDHIMLVVGDVSGKGVPAALFMMTAKTLISSYAEQGLSPKEIFERTNNQLCKGNEENLFVTCWLGILTFSTGELKYVNAGHPFPVIYQKENFSFLSEKPNFVLGGMSGLPYQEHSVKLTAGDRIFVYTDGVTEATDSKNRLFGDNRLLSAVQGTQNMNAPDTLTHIKNKIDEFVGETDQFDDITMLQFIMKNDGAKGAEE